MLKQFYAIIITFVAMTSASLLGAGPATAETAAERGGYIVNTIGTCGNCHTPRGGPMKGKAMAGGSSFGGPKAPFTAYAPNITQDRETGIGNWTDAQIAVAIREGKRPDGSIIGPPMPIELYQGISEHRHQGYRRLFAHRETGQK